MRFGTYSLVLSIAAVNGLFLAVMLVHRSGRHIGAHWLAILTACLALRLVPYILGFAGAYDTYPALTFAPFDVTLSLGPLLWIYVTKLATGAPPVGWQRHFVPAALQVGYQIIAFALPVGPKLQWYRGVHLEIVEPAVAMLVLASAGAYGVAAWRQYESWQAWLDANLSNREESRLGWLRIVLIGFGAVGGLGVLLVIVHVLIRPLDYFARLPVIAALGLLAYLIALLGYRHGGQAIAMSTTEPVASTFVDIATAAVFASHPVPAERSSPGKSYAAEATEWRHLVIREGWHRDSQLTLAKLAAALRVSTRSLSRSLNEGLGESFNDFVNRIRVEDAIRRLAEADYPDVLPVAFDVGFSSKAAFNRAFRRHAGATPTEVRAGLRLATDQDPPL